MDSGSFTMLRCYADGNVHQVLSVWQMKHAIIPLLLEEKAWITKSTLLILMLIITVFLEKRIVVKLSM